jgi:hypothetical protein
LTWHAGYSPRSRSRFSPAGAAENIVESTVVFHGPDGIVGDRPLPFFLERYAEGTGGKREKAVFG